ncbi:MAG: hypothetical protein RIQ53_1602 [Pseudomonadota bacterium]|jgi:methionyl-tRNA formyltransferase
MRIIYAGTPEFAAEALRALLAAGHEVPLVLTQPDRPAGRGMKLQASPVKQLALAHGLEVAQPRSLRLDGRWPEDAADAQRRLAACGAELMVVAAYGLILPRWTLALPPRGCINIHASLLPRWRGAAPIHRAIEAGDARTGITLMQMDEGLDTGAMLSVAEEPIQPDDTTATLHDRLAVLGGRLCVELLAGAPWPTAIAQPAAGVCYAHKIEKAESAIDWRQPAEAIARRVRAFDPFPGASFSTAAGETIKVWSARALPADRVRVEAAPGTVLDATPDQVCVACGDGSRLAVLTVQRPGGRRQPVAAWQQAQPDLAGQRLVADGSA